MSDTTQDLIGKVLTKHEPRDAVHIAVIAVSADAELWPGAHIGFVAGSTLVTTSAAPTIGIVDPFLRESVKPRERFWMFLYPMAVTSLRHHWDHPAISNDGVGVGSYSEKWLRDFATSVDAGYFEMMEVAATHCGERKFPDYLIEGGKWEGQGTPPEFWEHYKNVTGKEPVDKTYGLPGIFSCSC